MSVIQCVTGLVLDPILSCAQNSIFFVENFGRNDFCANRVICTVQSRLTLHAVNQNDITKNISFPNVCKTLAALQNTSFLLVKL